MGNFKLITTEKFCGVPCDFYKDTNDEILLTREQIGQALEYVNPIKAIQKIHLKHKDRLELFSVRIQGHPQSGITRTKSEEQERVYYTERGVMEICRWSRQPNANIFMDWAWDIIAQYRRNQLQQVDTSELANTIKEMSNTLYGLTQTVFQLKKDIKKDMEDNKPCCNNTQSENKKWSAWATKMYSKYELLAGYFCISHRELYKNLYAEFRNTYPDIDLAQCVDDYCHKHHLDSAYTLEAIEYNIHLRSMFESMVDSLLQRYGLLVREKRSHDTIFSM